MNLSITERILLSLVDGFLNSLIPQYIIKGNEMRPVQVIRVPRGIDLSMPISKLQDSLVNSSKPKKKTPFKKVHKNQYSQKAQSSFKKDINQKKIDDILDKISQSGYDSLTKEEKEFLFKAGK